jgi:hypothetical protein
MKYYASFVRLKMLKECAFSVKTWSYVMVASLKSIIEAIVGAIYTSRL